MRVPSEAESKETALVVGCVGQDGFYLTRELLGRGHRVVGIARDALYEGTASVGPAVSINDAPAIKTLLNAVKPDRIYYLAAHHHSSQQAEAASDDAMRRGLAVHVDGFDIMLSAACGMASRPKVFLASSSHVFGRPTKSPQDEMTPRAPVSAYGVTKDLAMRIADFYARHRDLFCASGVLYNHESPRRAPHFVSRRIADGVAAYARGGAPVVLGDLSAVVDWGAAEDYVRAMIDILDLEVPETFVVASGTGRTVAEFVETACRIAGVEAEKAAVEDASVIRAQGAGVPLIGDPTRLLATTGWRPRIGFEAMVRAMMWVEA
jgi:GDPmannose 4,6-dehydratase